MYKICIIELFCFFKKYYKRGNFSFSKKDGIRCILILKNPLITVFINVIQTLSLQFHSKNDIIYLFPFFSRELRRKVKVNRLEKLIQ